MDMNKEKWEIKKLGEVCDLKNGFAFKSSDYIPFSNTMNFRMSQIRVGGNVDLGNDPKYLPDSFANIYREYLLEEGDLVIAMTDMAKEIKILGVPTIVPQDNRNLLLNQRVGKLTNIDKSKIDVNFLKYALTTKSVSNYYKSLGRGGLQINLGKQEILKVSIPIPPLSTQEKIVSELDTLHRLKELQEQQLAELDNLAQSTFYHLFGDPIENEKGWKVKKLGEFTRIINGRAYKQEELLKEGKTPVLRVGNFFSNKDFYYSNLELDKDKYCDYGDLLYAWSASFGAKIWDGGKVIYHYHIWKIEINESICNKIFLFNILNLKTNYLKEQTHGIAMLHLTKSGMEDTNFILPPLSLQTQFSERIEKIETQKELIKQSIGETQLLIDYTMDKYFG